MIDWHGFATTSEMRPILRYRWIAEHELVRRTVQANMAQWCRTSGSWPSQLLAPDSPPAGLQAQIIIHDDAFRAVGSAS